MDLQLQREMELKESQYRGYIERHISNVKRAFERYGVMMCVAINCDPFSVKPLIASHDISKYSAEEFTAYRKWFYPVNEDDKNKPMFELAWEHHYQNNDHHPEYWVEFDKSDGVTILKTKPMTKVAIVHMICDWQSFMFDGKGSAYEYYYNVDRKEGLLHKDTRILVEKVLETVKNTKYAL